MEKLLAIAALGQRAYGRWLFKRLLSSIIMVTGLTIVTSIMGSAMLIGGLYAAYFTLLYYGIGQLMVMVIISILAILIIAILAFFTLACLRDLRRMPQTLFKRSPFTSRAMDTLDAFTDGLMAD